MTRYISGQAHQWVRAISVVNIPVHSNEVRYLSLMAIVNPLHARVYWPFQGGASFMGHTFGFRSITLEGMHQFHLNRRAQHH